MVLVDEKLLFYFATRHADMAAPIARWSKVLRGVDCSSFNELRRIFPSADYVRPYTIFNVAGNNARIVTLIDFESRTVVIRQVLMHAEYDKWSRRHRRGQA